jgi:hypothetical protein
MLSYRNISIKKQNLSILKSSNYYPSPQESIYIFKSATTNLLGTIFNYAQFEPYGDVISIYTEGNLNSSTSFLTDGFTFIYDDFTTNANNYVIPANSLLIFSTAFDINITVGGGAIIQKYYSGNLQIQKTYFDTFNVLTTNTTIVKLKLNGFPTFGELFGGAAFITNNNGQNIDNQFLFNASFANSINFFDENLQDIATYFPYLGSFYDAVSLEEYTDNISISAGGIWNNK